MVGARAPGTEQISQRMSFFVVSNAYKKRPCGVGGVPTGAGLGPRALIPGEGVREGLAWRAGLVGSGGVQGLRFRGGRHGPQGRSKFRNVCHIFVVSNTYQKEKNGFF